MDNKSKFNSINGSGNSRSSFDAKIPAKIRRDAAKEIKRREKQRKELNKRFDELQARRKKLLEQKLKIQEKLRLEESIQNQELLKLKIDEVQNQLKAIETTIEEEKAKSRELLLDSTPNQTANTTTSFERQDVEDIIIKQDEQPLYSNSFIKSSNEIHNDDEQNFDNEVIKETTNNDQPEIEQKNQAEEIDSINIETSENNAVSVETEPKTNPDDNISSLETVEEPTNENPYEDLKQSVLDETINDNVVSNIEEPQEKFENVKEEKEEKADTHELKAQKVSLEELQKVKEELNKEKVAQEEETKSTKKKSSSQSLKDQVLPPEESLTDDLTDEELEKYIQEEKKAQEQAILDAEKEAYEGMTEEEIKEAKERKLKFLELQRRYNSKENVNPSDMGDYQKNLDFTINKNLKKFKVKPPKSLYKAIAAVFISLIVISAVVAYVVLNQPPEPVVLNTIKLSQTVTYQTVGENLDLRGLYIYCTYSDGTNKTFNANESLISRTSSNINLNYKITGLDNSKEKAFVYFMIEDKEVKLDITLTQVFVNNVSASIYLESITAGDLISFDNLLLLANTSDGRQLRIDPKSCSYKMAGNLLTRTTEGFYMPLSDLGAQTLIITSTYNGVEYISFIDVYVNEPIEEEPEEIEEGNENQESETENIEK